MEEADIYESCRRIEEKLLVQFFGGDAIKAKCIREKRYWITIDDTLKHSGQVDCVYRFGVKALILEYKSLPGEVPASPKNEQLRDQAVLVDSNNVMLERIGVAVIQPLVTHNPELCEYNREEMNLVRMHMVRRVVRSNTDNPERIAGELQCKYCLAKMQCQKYQEWAGAKLPAALTGSLPLHAVADWTPEMRTQFLNQRKVAQDWLDNCEKECRRLLELDPANVPGWELKPGRVTEKVTAPQQVFDRFSAVGGSLEQFMSCMDVGKSKLKDALRAATKLKGKKLDEAMDLMLEGCVERKQSAPMLGKAGQ